MFNPKNTLYSVLITSLIINVFSINSQASPDEWNQIFRKAPSRLHLTRVRSLQRSEEVMPIYPVPRDIRKVKKSKIAFVPLCHAQNGEGKHHLDREPSLGKSIQKPPKRKKKGAYKTKRSRLKKQIVSYQQRTPQPLNLELCKSPIFKEDDKSPLPEPDLHFKSNFLDDNASEPPFVFFPLGPGRSPYPPKKEKASASVKERSKKRAFRPVGPSKRNRQ